MESGAVLSQTTSVNGFYSWPIAVGILSVANLAVYWANENGWLFRVSSACCAGRLPPSFHATRTVTGHRTAPRPRSYWAWDTLSPGDVVHGALVPTWVLLLFRVGLFVYFVINLIVEGAMDDGFYPYWMVFYTNWTLLGMGLQGLVDTVVTAQYLGCEQEEMEWGAGLKLMLLMDQTVPLCSLGLSIFYWTAVFSGVTDAGNNMKHGGNVVVMLATFLLARTPFVSYHIQVSMLYSTVYCVFMWVYAASTDVWAYSLLSTETSSSIIYYAIIPTLFTACFYFWFLTGMLRDFVSYKLLNAQPYDKMEKAAAMRAIAKSGATVSSSVHV